MAGASKTGTVWCDEELDAIVADYFAMLELELAGYPFVKAHRAAALMERIGRSHRSVEFKHMNISAVLSELGRPAIKGYTPLFNFQGAIFDAIDRFLTAHPRALESAPTPSLRQAAEAPALFEEPPPPLKPDEHKIPEPLKRLVRKFDPSERDFRNRTLGEAGERLVMDNEKSRLLAANRADLAEDVCWVSKERGDGAGYDIHSFDTTGAERLIEVKTTFGGCRTPFFLTRNERALSEERPDVFRIFRLYDFAQKPRLFQLHPPLEQVVVLEAENWRASFS
ncbi:MAG: DUF3883 domain-containing protein [Rhizomicrobium sp.]